MMACGRPPTSRRSREMSTVLPSAVWRTALRTTFSIAPRSHVGRAFDETVACAGDLHGAPAARGFVVGVHGDFVHHCCKVEHGAVLEIDAAVDARHRQQLADQGIQPFGFELDAIEMLRGAGARCDDGRGRARRSAAPAAIAARARRPTSRRRCAVTRSSMRSGHAVEVVTESRRARHPARARLDRCASAAARWRSCASPSEADRSGRQCAAPARNRRSPRRR